MSVARAQLEVSSREFTYWQALELLEPGEPQRSDAQAAVVCQTIVAALTGKIRPLREFMLQFEQAAPARTRAQVDAANKAYMSLLLGAPKKRHG